MHALVPTSLFDFAAVVSDRWYSPISCGQEFCQILAQWVWSLRLELGQVLSSSELRTTKFARASDASLTSGSESACSEKQTPQSTRYILRLREAFQAQLLPYSEMGHCVALPIVRCTPRHPERNGSDVGSCILHTPLALSYLPLPERPTGTWVSSPSVVFSSSLWVSTDIDYRHFFLLFTTASLAAFFFSLCLSLSRWAFVTWYRILSRDFTPQSSL